MTGLVLAGVGMLISLREIGETATLNPAVSNPSEAVWTNTMLLPREITARLACKVS